MFFFFSIPSIKKKNSATKPNHYCTLQLKAIDKALFKFHNLTTTQTWASIQKITKLEEKLKFKNAQAMGQLETLNTITEYFQILLNMPAPI